MLSLRLRLTVLGRGDAYKYAYLLVLPLNDMVIFRSFLQKTGRRRAATVCKFIIVYKLTFFVPARDAARILNPRTEGVGVQGFPVWIFVLYFVSLVYILNKRTITIFFFSYACR